MTKRRRNTVNAAAAQPNVPAVQLATIRGPMISETSEGRKAVDQLIREPLAIRAEWDDPDDTNTRSKSPRQVSGVRRAEPLLTIHLRSGQVTKKHLEAAAKLRDSYELAQGVVPGAERSEIHGSAGASGPTEMQLIAMDDYRNALLSVGPSLIRVLRAVVLEGMDVKTYAMRTAISRDVATGYLVAALDRLVDHYAPATTSRKQPALMVL